MARIQMDVAGSAGVVNGVGTSLGDTGIDLIVPETASASHPRLFPVLWLLHDYGGNRSDYLRYTNLEVYAREKEVIVVCPNGENSYYANIGKGWTGTADETYLTENLRNLVFSMFPASRAPHDNYLAGVGMGGYGAMHLLESKPAYYGTAISVLGELDAPNRYARGEFSHRWGDELFGERNRVEGGEKDLYAVEPGRLLGKKVIVAAPETDEAARRFCDVAKSAGANARLDTLRGERTLDALDGHVRYILSQIPDAGALGEGNA